MNSSKFRFALDLHSTQSQISIPVTKGDTARVWHISLSDGGLPYVIGDECLAKMEIKRPTGTFLVAFCPIENNTTIVYDFSQDDITKNTAVVAGVHDCSVSIYDSEGNLITSARFSMNVNDRVVNSDDINITDEDKATIDAMIAAEASRQAAEVGRVNAEAVRQTNEDERQRAIGKVDDAIKVVDDKVAEIVRMAENGEFDGEASLVDYRIKTAFDISNYSLKIALSDITGMEIHSDTVSLPIASTVVSGSVADGIVTLTLTNGNTISFGIGDLVDGLTTTMDVASMISSAITATLNTEV